jgi:hypothetical protein
MSHSFCPERAGLPAQEPSLSADRRGAASDFRTISDFPQAAPQGAALFIRAGVEACGEGRLGSSGTSRLTARRSGRTRPNTRR